MAFDRWLFRILVLSLCVLGVAQGLLRFESLRRTLSPAVRLEGIPLGEGFPALEEGEPVWFPTYVGPHETRYDGLVVLKTAGQTKSPVWILQNGFPLKVLRPEDGAVWVRDGDVLGIYAPNQTVRIIVSGVSENVAFPPVGFEIEGQQTFGLFRVGIKVMNQENATAGGNSNRGSTSTSTETTNQRDTTSTR